MFWVIKALVAILCAIYLFNGVTLLYNGIKNSYAVGKRHLIHIPKVKTGLLEMFICGIAFVALSIPLATMLAGNARLDPVTIGVDVYLVYVGAKLKVLI